MHEVVAEAIKENVNTKRWGLIDRFINEPEKDYE
jgi:hypothetical protein